MTKSINIKLNAWIICAVLLIANLTTIGLWQPWKDGAISDRTIKITGSTTIESEPDQFVFYPYYQKSGQDQTVINNELSELSKTIVAKLKTLGVVDSAIKTAVSSYDYGVYYQNTESEMAGTLNITVTLKDKDLAQKVQDYLITTSPSGSITPQDSFSTAKQKSLESQALAEALKDARSKAESSAKQVGATLGKVITIGDITNNNIPTPWMVDSSVGATDSTKSSEPGSYNIQSGLNEYSFSIEVEYELK
jgi:uncharacterized protein YggE